MKRRGSSPTQVTDIADIRVDRRPAADGRWKKIARRSPSRNDDIAIIVPRSLVDPTRSNIADQRRQVRHDFALDVEIPLHYVVAMGTALDRIVRKSCRAEKGERSPRERLGSQMARTAKFEDRRRVVQI